MKRALFAMGALMLATFSAHAWTAVLLDSPAVVAFVLSDRFWPSVFGLTLAFGFLSACACSALLFHPDTLPTAAPIGTPPNPHQPIRGNTPPAPVPPGETRVSDEL